MLTNPFPFTSYIPKATAHQPLEQGTQQGRQGREGTFELVVAAVEGTGLVLLDGSESGEGANEGAEVDALAVHELPAEEGGDDAVAEGVDGELGDADEVLPAQAPPVRLVQPLEAAVQADDLVLGDCNSASSIRSIRLIEVG